MGSVRGKMTSEEKNGKKTIWEKCKGRGEKVWQI